jgi:hypothetical protein
MDHGVDFSLRFLNRRTCCFSIVCLLFWVGLSGCGRSDPFPAQPAPAIVLLNPSNRLAGASDFPLQLRGSGFLTASQVTFNDTAVPTTFDGHDQLTAQIPASLIRDPGTYKVTVTNPDIGGGISNEAVFTSRDPLFSAAQNLSNTPQDSSRPAVAKEGSGAIHLLWEEAGEIFFSRFTVDADGKPVFSVSGRNVSNTPVPASINPAIAVDGAGNVNVVWEDSGEIFYSRFTVGPTGDLGFLVTRRNLSNSAGVASTTPTIGVDGPGNVNVAWEENGRIFFSRFAVSGSGAVTFALEGADISIDTGFSRRPRLAVQTAGPVHVVWEALMLGGNFNIFFSQAVNPTGAPLFLPAVNVSRTFAFSLSPAIAVDRSGKIHVAWDDDRAGSLGIFFSSSIDGGSSFLDPFAISDLNVDSERPNLITDGRGNINVVWQGGIPGEIFFTRSTDGGEFFPPLQNLSDTGGDSRFPEIAVDLENNVYAVWEDDGPGNVEILLSRGN